MKSLNLQQVVAIAWIFAVLYIYIAFIFTNSIFRHGIIGDLLRSLFSSLTVAYLQ